MKGGPIELYHVLPSVRAQTDDKLKERFALDVLKGFSVSRKRVPSRYLYDDRGSELFEKIMRVSDYYLTDCEREILKNHSDQILEHLGRGPLNLIELGAGNGEKTSLLLKKMNEAGVNFNYVPVDISEAAIKNLSLKLRSHFPDLQVKGVVGEYFDALEYVRNEMRGKNLLLFLGSNIGNFDSPDLRVFLRVLWKSLHHDDLALIGFDLKKDVKVMESAYNDSDGVTEAFNMNLLERMNRELGADFRLDRFRHHGFYNPNIGAMESYLISTVEQQVYFSELRKSFHFKAYEAIHVEYSNKFLLSALPDLAQETGFRVVSHFQDSREYFVDSLWRTVKE